MSRKELGTWARTVRKLRIDQGETMTEMSDAIGLSLSHLSAIEKGDRALSNEISKKVRQHFKDASVSDAEWLKAENTHGNSIKLNLKEHDIKRREAILNLVMLLERRSTDQILEDVKSWGARS